jgi:hypothetical protein
MDKEIPMAKSKFRPPELPDLDDAAERSTMAIVPLDYDQRMLDEFGIAQDDAADFYLACTYVQYRLLGLTTIKAAEKIGRTRQLLYTTRWKALIAKAEQLIRGDTATTFKAAASLVAESFLKMVQELINDVMDDKTRPLDKKEIVQFLFESFGANAVAEAEPDKGLSAYLKNPNITNPLALLNINVNVQTAGGEQQESYTTIDVQADSPEP